MKKTKNKNKYILLLKEQLSKFMVVFIAFSMFVSFSNVNQTYAYFSDTATIEGNTFTAGTLDITLNNTNTFSSGLMYPTDTTSTSMDISNTGSLNSQYIAKTTLSGSDTTACDYVIMTATSPTSSTSGFIKDFISTATPTTNATWNYNFTISPTAPASVWGKTCFFKWTYTAWQDNLNDASTGFTNTKEKLGEINIGKAVVMNEILPNPEGDDGQHGLQGEWVELYNNSNNEIDLNGWYIKDVGNHTITISSGNTWNSRTKIGKKGSGLEWVVVFMNGEILNNTGDTVSFYSPTNNLVDQYTFGNSVNDTDSDSHNTPAGNNQNSAGDETAGNEGKSYARIPDGTGEWIDPIPTPGEPNIDGEVELLLENDSPVILDQTIDTLVKDIMNDSTLEVVEETTTEQPATDTTTDGTITADQPAQDTEDTTTPTEDEDLAIEPAIEEVTVVEPVVKEVVSKPVVKEETEPIVPEVVEPVITE